MPRAGSEGFVVPTSDEQARFEDIAAEIQGGNSAQAGGIAAEFGYELIQYQDRGDNNSNEWLLREIKPIRKGWGLYVFRSNASHDVIVEAPHPLYDEGTPAIAVQVYRTLQARALLVAGAHRYANHDQSSDVAHSAQSIFEAVHEAITKTNSTIILQIHGFAASKHSGYPRIVLSSDEAAATGLIDRLVSAFDGQGVNTGKCGDGQWVALCGETNVQSLNAGPAIFIHMELSESIRSNDAVLLQVLAQVLLDR